MTKTFKIAYCGLVAGAVALFAVTQSAQAIPINGSISMHGDETAYVGTSGTGAVDGDLSTARSIVFNLAVVSTSPAPNGSFTGLGGLSVTMAPFLNINPAVLPAGAIWSVAGYSLTLSSLSTLFASQTSLTLFGTGTFSDGIPADNTAGNWTATFTSSGPGTTGVTFGFNSSSTGIPTTVPDAGSSLLLLGLGLTALAAFAKFSKQVFA
jgi:hypothetical protein